MNSAPANPATAAPTIPPDKALEIARLDAEAVYRDLDRFRIEIVRESDGWHIEYYLKNPNLNGGGPHYLIDPVSGVILAKKYYQ